MGSLRYWRCWPVFDSLSLVLWPTVGHMVWFDRGDVRCERCDWHEPLPIFFTHA